MVRVTELNYSVIFGTIPKIRALIGQTIILYLVLFQDKGPDGADYSIITGCRGKIWNILA